MIEFTLEKSKIRLKCNEFESIREHFSVKDETARFRLRGRSRFAAPSRVYCITPTGLFEYGMFFDILTYIKKERPNEQIIVGDGILELVKPGLGECRVYDNLKHELRDYQRQALLKALNSGRGVLKMGTGAGKTLTIASLLMSVFTVNKNFKCLIIVPDLSLVSQTYSDFEEYNVLFKATRWTGKIKPDLTANVIIANLGILQSRFDDYDFLKYVDILVIDECHKLKKSNKINKMVEAINTNNKFGLTGTLPDNKVDEWNILGKLGNVIYDKDSYSLREENYLTTVNVSFLKIKYKKQPKSVKDQNPYKTELDFLYANEFRNNIITTLCAKFKNNSLVLVNHLIHGDALYNELIKHKDKQVFFVKGEMEVEVRDEIKKIMETNNNVVCIAMSSIFSTGINIKNIHMIIFASGGKSFVRTIQSIGRGLRLHDNKDKLVIIDIVDNLKYGIRHAEKRQEIYKLEKINYKSTEIVEN